MRGCSYSIPMSLLFCIFVGMASADTQNSDEDTSTPPKGHLVIAPQSGFFTEASPPLNQFRRVIYRANFDAAESSWRQEGAWYLGPLTFHGTSRSGAASSSLPLYQPGADARLISPRIELPSLTPRGERLFLRFDERYEIESSYDWGQVEISTDGGHTWLVLGYRSGQCDWFAAIYELTAYAGQSVQIAFHFHSDNSDEYEGWLISDVRIEQREFRSLSVEIPNLNHQGFPWIFMDLTVEEDGIGILDLPQDSFSIFENNVIQVDQFEVSSPGEGEGFRSVDIVFLMDNSGSMEGEIEAVSLNVANFVADLASAGTSAALGLCRFGQISGNGNPILEDGGNLTTDPDYFVNDVWARNIDNGEDEPGYYAICSSSAGFAFRPGARRVFIIITDETPDQGGCSLNDALAACQGNDITLFALTISSLYNEFTPITDATGGAVINIFEPMNLIFEFIESQVSDTYRVRYRSTTIVQDDIWHDVTVEVQHEDEVAFAYASYLPGSSPKIDRTAATKALSNQSWAQGTNTLLIEAVITDTHEPFVESATLYYRVHGEQGYFSQTLDYQGSDTYAAYLPANTVQDPGVDYYLTATDGVTTTSAPFLNPVNSPYQIAVLPNYTPTIAHMPPPIDDYHVGDPLAIEATVVDQTDFLVEVSLHYRELGPGDYRSANMVPFGGDSYRTEVPGDSVTSVGIEYYVYAEDNKGIGNSSGTADEPHVLRPWIDTEDAVLTFVVIESQMTSAIKRVELRGNLNLHIADTEVVNHFASFSAADLSLDDPNDSLEIRYVLFFNIQGTRIGHIEINSDKSMLGGWGGPLARNSLELIVFLHDDLPQISTSNEKYKDFILAGWETFEENTPEYLVSMLVPPGGEIENIEAGLATPLLFVHGIDGQYPYWRKEDDSGYYDVPDQYLGDANPDYDPWEFYYQNDIFIDDSAVLLGRAIAKLTQPGGVFNTGHYTGSKVVLIGDSMGCLVSRQYIQSAGSGIGPHPSVARLFMFVPPNHGSHASFIMRHKPYSLGALLAEMSGKDRFSPAHVNMSPGSNLTTSMNAHPPRELGAGDITRDYLVLAGFRSYPDTRFMHSEIDEQDDGFVAVSSASLLDFSVPLLAVFEHHLDLRTSDIGIAVLEQWLQPSFEFGEYWPNSVAYARRSLTEQPLVERGAWESLVDPSRGLNLLQFPHIVEDRSLMDAQYELDMPFIRLVIDDHNLGESNRIRYNPDSDIYVSYETAQLNDIAFNSIPPGEYDLMFSRLVWGFYHQDLGRTQVPLIIKPLVTTTQQIQLSSELAFALDTPNSEPIESMDPLINLSGEVEYAFSVDGATDTLLFSLSAGHENADFADHGFQIREPSGMTITPEVAEADPNMNFEEDILYGLAHYFVIEPETGEWELFHNSDLSEARLAVYYRSEIEARLFVDETRSGPDSAFVAVTLSESAFGCTDQSLTTRAFFSPDGIDHEDGGEELNLEELQDQPGQYETWFVPNRKGKYFFDMRFTCDAGDGQMISRRSYASTVIGFATDSVISPQGLFYPNPFDPTVQQGVFRISLPTSRECNASIYDAGDHFVRTLHTGMLLEGHNEVLWDGRNAVGEFVANGVYFIVLDCGDGDPTVTKIAVLK